MSCEGESWLPPMITTCRQGVERRDCRNSKYRVTARLEGEEVSKTSPATSRASTLFSTMVCVSH